ncbi:MAG TPA: HEAT repeat domain-containing protein [Planctomycetota bacterium]|nr:HEAT repeat domain-containing protein [Planctomycetota bacterium]
MRAALVALLLAVPAFVATRGGLFDPAPDPVVRAFERAERAVAAFADRRAGDGDLRPFNSLLPVGYWALLVEAFPDVAFARYAGRLDGGATENRVARWAVHRLAQLGHPAVKPLLLGRLSSPDPETRAHAVRLLGLLMDPSVTPLLLARMPETPDGFDDHQLASDILRAVSTSPQPDASAVARALERYARHESSAWFGTDGARLRLEVLSAADPVQAAERGLFEDRRDRIRDEFEEWLPAYAARARLAGMAPLLRRRAEAEIARGDAVLDPAARGEPLMPQRDAFWRFRGAFVLAAYRKALRDLGVPLTPEERRWLEAHRLLRPARDYLVEAGLLPAR